MRTPSDSPARPIVTALLGGWGACVVAIAAPGLWANLTSAARAFSEARHLPRWPALGINLATEAATIAIALGLAVCLSFSGRRMLRWFGRGVPASRSVRWFAAPLLGYGAASLLLLGWLFVKLWFPVVLALSLLPLLVPARRPGVVGSRQNPAPFLFPHLPWWVVGAFLLWLPWLLTPETHEDAWTYHLAAPRRWLDLHGLCLAHVDVSMHFPMTAELVYAFPLLLGLDAVPKWLNALGYLAGAGALVAVLAPAEPALLWVTLGTTATSAVFATAKSDGFATGAILCALAIGLEARRKAGAPAASAWLAGIVAGLALASKNTSLLNVAWIPIVLVWMHGTGRGRWLARWVIGAAIPLLPWLAKSWLLTGDPVYPGPGMILALVPVAERSHWLGASVRGFVSENAAVAWILPAGLLLAWSVSRLALVPLATYLAWYIAFPTVHTPRFAFPAFAAAACLLLHAPLPALAGSARFSRVVFLVLVGFSAVNRTASSFGAAALAPDPFPYLLGAETRSEHVFRGLTGVEEARRFLVRERAQGGAVLLVSEWHQYGMPQPCYEAAPDLRKPPVLLWDIVRSATTEADVRRAFRRLRVGWIVYNPVRALNAAHQGMPVAWTDAQLRLWHGFFRKWTSLAQASENLDFRHGALYVYRLLDHPTANKATPLHLPGVETLFGHALALEYAGDMEAAFQAARKVNDRMGPVTTNADTVGLLAFQAHRHDETLTYLRGSVEANFVDGENFFLYGLSAFLTGRFRDAAEVLPRAAAANPHRAPVARMYAAASRLQLARVILDRDPASADRECEAAVALLTRPTPLAEGISILAVAHASRAVIMRSLGRNADAATELGLAAAVNPGLPGLSGPALRTWVLDRIRELASGPR
ncbi:MAG: hypothetical protein AAB152_17795 [Candidatus Coatesbacteria bacterium]